MSTRNFEQLESRRYFSVPTPVTVSGTDGADQIFVKYSSEMIQVYINEGTNSPCYFRLDDPPSNLTLVIKGKGGNDTIKIGGIDFGGSVRVEGGAGNDHVIVGAYGRYATHVDGPVTVVGGDGRDDVTVDASKDTTPAIADIFTVTDQYIGWGGTNSGGATFNQWEVNYDNTVEFARLKGMNEPSTIHVLSTSASTPVQVDAGSSTSTINVGNADLDNIKGRLSIYGQGGTDTLRFSDIADSGNDWYELGLTRLRKSGIADMYFYEIEKTELDGNGNSDTFNVLGVSSPTTVRGMGGDDSFFVGDTSSLKYLKKSLSLQGGGGSDRVIANSQADTTGKTYTVTGSSLHWTGAAAPMTFSSQSKLFVNSGSGDDVFNVTPTLGTTINLIGGANATNSPGDQMSFSSVTGTPLLTEDQFGTTFQFAGRNPVFARGVETMPKFGASISGMLFNDKNGDGDKDGDAEQSLGGRGVYIDLDNDKVWDLNEPKTGTNGDGKYLFLGLNPGTYKVRQIIPSGWQQTSPAGGYGQGVTLAANQQKLEVNFGSQVIV